MPATPFIGISILIHVAVIIFHKFFKFPAREASPVTAITTRHIALSGAIVVGMFSIMLMTAVGLLSASVHEKHSTVYLLEDTAQWLAADNGGPQVAAAVTGAYRAQATSLAVASVVIFGIIFIVPRIRFPQRGLSVSQGGHSAVSVSLLISGFIALFVGAAYVGISLLIAIGLKF